MTRRLSGLDALRGIAAISVVLYHYTTGYPSVTGHPYPLPFTVKDGHYGVELFFIISGFVIFMTLERTRDWTDFLRSRVGRLWPAFTVCLGVTAAALWLVHPAWAAPLSLRNIAANLTMMPAVFHHLPADPSYWSLAYEIFFYGLAGSAYYVAGTERTELLCLVWLIASVVARVLHKVLDIDRGEYLVETLTAVRFASFFVIGIMLYRIRTGTNRRRSFALLLLALASVQLKWSYRPISSVGFVMLIAGFTALVWIGTLERSPLARLRPLVFLGEISYPLYVVHQIVGYMVIGALGLVGFGPVASLFTCLALIVLLAAGIHQWVELPAQRLVRQLRPGFAARPPVAAAELSVSSK